MADTSMDAAQRSTDNLNGLCGQQLSITFGNEDKQYFCFCWGVCRDRFIMTQIPVDTDIQAKLVSGATVVIRYIESGMVCGFKTHVHKVLTTPFRLIFFEYPDVIDRVNLRHSKRVSIFLKAEILWKGETYEGTIRDLSEGGCYFEMKYWRDPAFGDLEVGSTLTVKFTIHGEKNKTELSCKVVRLTKNQDDLRLGLAFDGVRLETTGRVRKFVSYISKLLDV